MTELTNTNSAKVLKTRCMFYVELEKVFHSSIYEIKGTLMKI